MLTTQERLRVLSRLFTRPTVTALAKTGDWKSACRFLSQYNLLRASKAQALAALFESAWHELRQLYRNEYIYKSEVANRIVFGRHSPRTAALHLEFPVGRSIVDVAIFNGTSTAYEIKTEFDSARRLKTQTRDYTKAFEAVYVVAHPALANSYVTVVAPEVGVLALDRRGSLSEIKAARKSQSLLDHSVVFRCLRREEYLRALRPMSPELTALPNGVVGESALALFRTLSKREAHDIYVGALRMRKTEGATRSFALRLPESLRALGYGIPLSRPQQETLLWSLSQPIEFAIV
jgi:hypothetical protein